jgi:hypothetical protein
MYGGSVAVMARIIYACNTLCILRILDDASAVFSVQHFL